MRPDKGDSFLGAALGKASVLGKETVTGMDAIATARFRERDQRLDIKVCAHRVAGGRAVTVELARLRRQARVQPERIG